ncbi:MAG: Holliday junction resolvase RuvX [Gammaproteobacteria bacterium]|nr:Holliday junction resolvase RuvX [Gammaproteobacteria bacterium]
MLENTAQHQVYIAFDFGERRTGIAVGQSITGIARPLATITSINKQPNWALIEDLIKQWQPTQLIVGIPDDIEKNKALRKKINLFCSDLATKFGLPVFTHDETLTSDEAYLHLKNKRRNSKGKIDKQDIDQIAAAILLESWMSVNLPK